MSYVHYTHPASGVDPARPGKISPISGLAHPIRYVERSMPQDPQRLRNLLLGLLDSAEGWLPTIERAFVSAGRPDPECEALAVWVEDITAPNPAKAGCSVEPRATFHVNLYQCLTMTTSGEVIQRDALDLADDAWAMWCGILVGFRDGTLFGEDASVACGSIDLSRGMRVVPTLGGIGGWEATIIVTL